MKVPLRKQTWLPVLGLGRLQEEVAFSLCFPRFDVSEDGEGIAEEEAMWANAGEFGPSVQGVWGARVWTVCWGQ